ncbi:MAG: DNA sulfur modification protein DndD [Nitrosopumilus sp.]|nr:DNA sulfur modification protein DndD [Nitrosopumilus sp.]NRA06465.1 DNA sulfur modification protein DndD [Nitrosopumilus sp.]
MHLTKVTLKNYGVYRDKIEFDLTTTPDKPVILIGGTNGAGKTTLFESILIGFYGPSFFNKKTTRKEYDKCLANKIHRYLGTKTSADSTSIIIDFKFFHNGMVDDYTVDRTWKNEDGRIMEELKIKKNGERLDSVEESQWQSFIEELIPRGIAKLFFFDGEKIVKMAEEENEDIEIKSSFDSLLGLDVVEQLHSDLRVHIMRNMKDDAKIIQSQHDKHLEERDEILDDISRYKEKLASKNVDLDKLAGEINVIETNISKIGGGFASKRTDLQAKKAFLEMKIASIENDLRVMISGPLPFCIIPKQTQSLKSQIKKDSKVLKNQFEKEILSEKINEISQSLNSKKLWSGVNIDSKTREKLVENISLLLSPDEKTENITSVLNFSTLEASNTISLIDNLKTKHLDKLNKKSQEFNESSDELQRIDVSLVNAPNDDEIGPLITELNDLHENQGIIKNEIMHLEKQVTTKQSYLKMINVKLRNILSDKYKDKNAGIQAELATRVQKVLDEYIEKLKIKKLQLLEEYLLEEVKRLMHKDNLITKVSVNKETFEITLYDKDGNPFPKDLLSKGEKQMYATAVLLALAKTSGKPLPFMIDTPLARLDIGHRDNLIKKFFPYASHQVVIFSTDSEIDEKYYPKLKPYLSRSYAMEYLPSEGKTKQHLGYFWDDKGVKIIAV